VALHRPVGELGTADDHVHTKVVMALGAGELAAP
jgi:hypothetical protein